MILDRDSVVYVEGGQKRVGDLEVGELVVGADARPSVAVTSIEAVDSVPLVTISSKHRRLTASPATRLLMLRRSRTERNPPRGPWWTEPHPISDLSTSCAPGAACSITECWCLEHKRHFVTLASLPPEALDVHDAPHRVGAGRRLASTIFEDESRATEARFAHIAHGHVVTPVRTTGRGFEVAIAATNKRVRQIVEWRIDEALPGPEFSVERVSAILDADPVPAVEISAEHPIVVQAMLVIP